MSPPPTPVKRASKAIPAKRKYVLLPPPPLLPDEVQELFAQDDITELEYRHIAEWRQRVNNTPEIHKKLATHDRLEKRLHETPEDVLREAYKAIDHGTSLLLKLIRSRRMHHTLEPTAEGKAAGLGPHSWDDSFNCLAPRIDYLNRQLIRLAEAGVPEARTKLFYQAKALTAAFVRLAQAFPADFRDVAESSLTMPSLRARTPHFTADAQVIAERIHLAEKHPASGITDNRERLGALCHVLVAEFVEAVAWERRWYQYDLDTFERMKAFKETAAAYRDVTFEDWMRGRYYPTRMETLRISAGLPPLKDDPNAWWQRRILPMVKEEFTRIAKQPVRNAALWEELEVKAAKHTPAAMRRLMEKNCRNKLLRIAKTCP